MGSLFPLPMKCASSLRAEAGSKILSPFSISSLNANEAGYTLNLSLLKALTIADTVVVACDVVLGMGTFEFFLRYYYI